MKNIVNSYYSQDLSRKITSTFDVKREKGEFFFNAPYGYLKDPENRGKILIDDEAAAIVRRIFSLACKGWGPGDIAKSLNREQIPTKAAYNREHGVRGRGATLERNACAAWTGAKVSSVLKNEVYMGTYVTRRSRRAAAGAKRAVPVTDAKRIPNNHPAIVSGADFAKAQAVFRRARGSRAEARRYQLRSKVYCGCCGYAMAYSGNLYEDCYFSCAHTMQTGNRVGCSRARFPEELLNDRVFVQLRQWMLLLETACGAAEAAEQNRQEGLRLLEERAGELREELRQRQERGVVLYESYREGTLRREELLAEKRQLSAEQDAIRTELDSVHRQEARLRRLCNRREPELDDLMEKVRLFADEKKLTRAMVETFVERVTVWDKWHIEIIWKEERQVEAALRAAAEPH
ncbi:MAG: recombinase family protein [Clostridiales bacterium]|nr:recombinase family protein [Clostridiales bacterium]